MINELNPHEKYHQSPAELFLQQHQNDPIQDPPSRLARLKPILLLMIGAILGYGYYYIRIRGIL